MPSDEVTFEVLLCTPASGGEPHVETIDQFRPSPNEIERCRRWFSAQGVTSHATGFGLTCSVSRRQFEFLFGVTLTPVTAELGQPPFEMEGAPTSPPELASVIEQITLAVAPELF